LPSGGIINPVFEADDYAYVQDKKAMVMHKIINVGEENPNYDPGASNPADRLRQRPDGTNGIVKDISNSNSTEDKNRWIYFQKDPSVPIYSYISGIDDMYFKCLMEFDDGVRYDYVPGYAQIKSYGEDPNDASVGYIELEPVSFNDISNNAKYSPIALSGIQFGRLHLPRFVWDSPSFNENQTLTG